MLQGRQISCNLVYECDLDDSTLGLYVVTPPKQVHAADQGGECHFKVIAEYKTNH